MKYGMVSFFDHANFSYIKPDRHQGHYLWRYSKNRQMPSGRGSDRPEIWSRREAPPWQRRLRQHRMNSTHCATTDLPDNNAMFIIDWLWDILAQLDAWPVDVRLSSVPEA